MQAMSSSLLGSVLQMQWLEMDKGKTIAVFLTHRESGNVGKEIKNVDWDDLVDDVFKEEVDQFFIESGVHSLQLRQLSEIKSSNLGFQQKSPPSFSS